VEELAEVYARSLFEVARDTGRLDVVREQLGQVADAVGGDRELQTFFFSPYFSVPEKEEGFDRAFTGTDPIVRNFLGLLIEKHRMPVLFRVRQRFEAMWQEENRVLPVQITSAIPLDEATVRSIGDRIGSQTGRRIQLSADVDPDVLGGLVLRVGNSVVDASIRNRLENLRRSVARG
jgi:ATP synthase F1 delta subunit